MAECRGWVSCHRAALRIQNVVMPGMDAEEVDARPNEDGGPSGLEPTRFGDWERKGLAVDF
jgi:hypothetical protein